MRQVLWIALLPVAVALSASAEPDISAHVDRTEVSVGRDFLITVEASGSDVGEPEIPDADGLVIQKNPRQSSNQLQLQFGKTTTTKSRRYVAQATREGKITIPPIGVPVDGSIRYTKPIVLTAQRGVPPARRQETKAAQQDLFPPETRAVTWDKAVRVNCIPDKTEVYQGEAIRVLLQIWVLADHHIVAQMEPLPAEGFYAIPQSQDVLQKRARRSRTTENSLRYEVTEYAQTFFPTTTGELTIGPWRGLAGQERALFGIEPGAELVTDPIVITSKPLPPAPANFSGAVGTFALEGHLSREKVVQGVPANLILTITGQGNPGAIGKPRLPNMENVYVSEAEVKSIGDPNDIEVNIEYTFPITPLTPGMLRIPEVDFGYFEPATGEYKTASTGPFSLEVMPSAEKGGTIVASQSVMTEKPGKVDVIGEDIHPQITTPGPLRVSSSSRWLTTAVLVLPVFLYAVMLLLMQRRRRFEHDISYARAYKARSRYAKRLHAVAHAEEPTDALYRTLIEFIADKSNLPSAGMTSADIEGLFDARGLDSDIREPALKILRTCERARYASARLSSEELTALINAAIQSVDVLDGALKGR